MSIGTIIIWSVIGLGLGKLISKWGFKDKKTWVAVVVAAFAVILFGGGGYPYSSLDDFESELDGNTYVFDGKTNRGDWYKVVVNGNQVTLYIASPKNGSWGEPYSTFTGEYKEDRFIDSGDKYYALEFGIWTLFCPSEKSSMYERNSSAFNDGALMLSDGEDAGYLMKKGDSNPWD